MNELESVRRRNILVIKIYWVLVFLVIFIFLLTDNYIIAISLAFTVLPPMFLITYFEIKMMKLQSKLNEKEKRFKAMVKQSSDGIFAFNPKTKEVVETNERFCHLLGYAEDELLQLKISDFIVSDFESIEKNIDTIMKKERFIVGEKLYRCKDGKFILVEVSGSVIHLQNDSIILANVRDITERVESAALIQRQGRLLNSVAEAMHCLLTNENHNHAINEALEIIGRALQVERVYIFQNHLFENEMAMSQRYQWSNSEKIAQPYNLSLQNIKYKIIGNGRWYEELLAGRVINGPVKSFPDDERILLERQSLKSLLMVPIFILDQLWGFISFDDFSKERQWSKSEVSILFAAAAGIGGTIKLNQDELLLQESERKYRLLSARLQALISHMHYGVLAEDKDGRLIFSNDRFKEIFNLPIKFQFIGKMHEDIFKAEYDLGFDRKMIAARTKEIITSRKKVLGEEWQLKDGRTISRDGIPIFTNQQFDGYLWLLNDITKQKAIEQKLIEASLLDGLTNIFNRRYFDQNLLNEWKRCLRNTQPLSLIMIDIDCFKDFNDTYGHQSGDKCLKRIAQTIKNTLQRPSDFVCRYGGEEFVIVLPDTPKDGGYVIAEKIGRAIELLQIPHATSIVSDIVTCSFGVASMIPNLLTHPQELVNKADKALYQSKKSGRNRVSV